MSLQALLASLLARPATQVSLWRMLYKRRLGHRLAPQIRRKTSGCQGCHLCAGAYARVYVCSNYPSLMAHVSFGYDVQGERIEKNVFFYFLGAMVAC